MPRVPRGHTSRDNGRLLVQLGMIANFLYCRRDLNVDTKPSGNGRAFRVFGVVEIGQL
jgi:hypothetical protein